MKVGGGACNIMRRELDKILAAHREIEEVVYLDAALHVTPEKMKETLREEILKIKEKVDLVFLGYGYC